LRRILIVGSGGREHVLAWRLTQDAVSCNLHAAPGNPGIARIGTCHAVTDISALVELARGLHIDLTIVGPEAPLAAGIVDTFQTRGLRIFGPTQQAAEIESSKAFAKTLMRRCGIPTADFAVFDDAEEAIAYVRRGGPNTGGMGAVAPAPLSDRVLHRVVDEILEPIASAMVREGRPYTGVLYAGIMETADGPKVLEFNCRFGDPEAQVILPLLRGDLAGAMIEMLEGRPPRLDWRNAAAVCVVLASGGYPARYDTGVPIAGLEGLPEEVLLFHAGTAVRDGRLVTAGGRVLNVVGLGPTPGEARDRAYAGAARIRFDGMQFRRDIGARAASVPEEVNV
jgi:phosphoribosylamine-glycine ligase